MCNNLENRCTFALRTEMPDELGQDTPSLGSNNLGTASVCSAPHFFSNFPSFFIVLPNDTGIFVGFFFFYESYFGLGPTI